MTESQQFFLDLSRVMPYNDVIIHCVLFTFLAGTMSNVLSERGLQMMIPDCLPEVQAAVVDYVHRVATEHVSRVRSITLYGSQARGEASTESDIDLFVVVRDDAPAVCEALADLAWEVQFEHDVVLSDVIRTEEQLRRMQAKRFPYYQSIERDGILLWKSTSEPMLSYA